jgi:hypothetical protein
MGVIAYCFISLSGIIYYDPFVAMFIGLVSGLLMRTEREAVVARGVQVASALPASGGVWPAQGKELDSRL